MNRKAAVAGTVLFVAFLWAWHANLMPLLVLNVTELLVPDDEDLFGDCVITESRGTYNVTERLRSMEYACENICADAVAGNADYKEVTCRFESNATSWEKASEDVLP